MQAESSSVKRYSLLSAIAASLVLSSAIVFALGFFGARPFLIGYVRDVVRDHHASIEDFFTDSISQQILVGDGPEVLRKCHTLLRKDYIRAVYIKDLGGEVVCNLKKADNGYAIRWTKSAIYFDEDRKEVATQVWLAFSTQSEEMLIWAALIAAFAGAALLLVLQFIFTIPLSRRILKPLADISSAVAVNNPEDIELPDLQQYRPLVAEVRNIFQSMHSFLERFKLYKSQLIESTRYEAVARTVQIIAHDLKAPMASFERLTRIPENQFAQERKHLVQALQQLYSMTDAIKRAEFEDIVRLKTDHLDLTLLQQNSQPFAEKLEKNLVFDGPSTISDLSIDQPKLVRALGNLVINALEAARSQVLVSVRRNPDQLLIIIADDGPGVPVELQQRLFTRGGTAGKAQGTGLGLHYARRAAEGHGGDLRYERVKDWTRFVMSIPCEPETFTEPLGREAIEVPARPTTLEKDCLLIVVDSARTLALRSKLPDPGIDIFQPEERQRFQGKAYRYIVSEDWDLAAELRPLQQKILFDPSDPLEKLLIVVERLRKQS